MSVTTFDFPTTIRFGVGALSEVAAHLAQQGLSRPLVVTDRGVAELDFHEELLESLRGEGLATTSFSEVWGNPVASQVSAGVAHSQLGGMSAEAAICV